MEINPPLFFFVITKYNYRCAYIATYERGVEDETLSCGTGVVASALIWAEQTTKALSKVYVKTIGGFFDVSFQKNTQGKFENIYLLGPVRFVFEGTIEV